MLRRDFLGSTLGFFTTTSIPWIARPSVYKKSIPRPNFVLPFYKTAIRLDNGLIIQGPGIKEIDPIKGFIWAEIEVKIKLVVKNAILIYKNQIFSEKSFDYPFILCEGDKLNVDFNYKMHFTDAILTPSDPNFHAILDDYLIRKTYDR